MKVINKNKLESLILDFEKQKGKTVEEKWEDVRKMEEERKKNLNKVYKIPKII